MEGFVTVSEAAKLKNLSSGHIRQLCIDGKLEGVQKLGRNWAIPVASLDKYTPGLKGYAAYWEHKNAEKRAEDKALEITIQKALSQ